VQSTSTEALPAARSLSVHRLAIDLAPNQFVAPGETIGIYASANRTDGVQYSWSVSSGEYELIHADYIEFTVPTEAADTIVSVTVEDPITKEQASKSLTIKNSARTAVAVPSNYTYRMTQENAFNMKISGRVAQQNQTRVSVDGDITRVEAEFDGKTIVSEIRNGEMYISDQSGSMRSLGSMKNLLGNLDLFAQQIDSFDMYERVLGQPTRSGTTYHYSKSVDDIHTTLDVDTRSGFPLRNSSHDELTGEQSETIFTYQQVDGYLFPDSITQITRIPLGDETVESSFTMKIQDIELGTVTLSQEAY
jgi:hypothetical protein